MKQALILAGIAMLASAGPVAAQPGKAKHNKGHQGQVFDHRVGQPQIGSWTQRPHGCPPGLAKKMNGCNPPGQVKHLFNVGQRVPYGYNGLMGYNALPYDLRNQYGPQLDPYGRYIYQDNYLYNVDPKTMIVRSIIQGLLYR